MSSIESRLDRMNPGPELITRRKFFELSADDPERRVSVERASMEVIAKVCESVGTRALRVVGSGITYYPFDSDAAHLRGSRAVWDGRAGRSS